MFDEGVKSVWQDWKWRKWRDQKWRKCQARYWASLFMRSNQGRLTWRSSLLMPQDYHPTTLSIYASCRWLTGVYHASELGPPSIDMTQLLLWSDLSWAVEASRHVALGQPTTCSFQGHWNLNKKSLFPFCRWSKCAYFRICHWSNLAFPNLYLFYGKSLYILWRRGDMETCIHVDM